jgi:hypothetical protein
MTNAMEALRSWFGQFWSLALEAFKTEAERVQEVRGEQDDCFHHSRHADQTGGYDE